MPVVTTLHTVLASPSAIQRTVTDRIVGASAKVVVMAEKARELQQSVHRVPHEKIEVIAHVSPTFHLSRRTRQRQDWDSAAVPSF